MVQNVNVFGGSQNFKCFFVVVFRGDLPDIPILGVGV